MVSIYQYLLQRLEKATNKIVNFLDHYINTNYTWFIVYPLLFVASALWIVHKWQQRSRLFILGNRIPGPKAVPFFGNALLALGKKPDQLVKLSLEYAEKYGTVIRGWMGTKLVIFLLDAEDVEVLLSSQIHITKSTEYRFFKPWIGEGLLTSTGSKWRYQRKIVAPTFHTNILKSFFDVFNQTSKNIADKMKSEIGKTFDAHDYMSTAAMSSLLETAMGVSRKTQDESGFNYAMVVMKMCDIIHQRHYKLWLRFDAIFKFTTFFKKQKELLSLIHGFTNKVLQIKKQKYFENKAMGYIPPTIAELTSRNNEKLFTKENITSSDPDHEFKGQDDLDYNNENDIGKKKHAAFLDLLIESAQNGTYQLTDHEIKELVDTIMFAGRDALAASSSFVLCLLGVYKNFQDKVYNELYEIFGDSDRPATYADTLQMKYLERVILETLRIYPPVPVIARELYQDVKIVTNDYVLPAGATVVICTYKIHHSSKYYKDPETFNPDNFLPENTSNRHFYSHIPFSAGPRSCVGRKYALLKLKVLLSTILRNYKCTSPVPEDQFQLLGDIILKRLDGFRIQIEPRKRVPHNVA